MAANNLIKEDDIKILNDENVFHDELFQEFDKKVFDKMLTEAIFLGCKSLEREGKRPGVRDFENELNYLTRHIMEERIKLLGTFLKNGFIVWFYYLVMV